mgnify:CR=1 FL=1
MGADDYVTKPFNSMELMARAKSQLRRYMSLGNMQSAKEADKLLVCGALSFDTETKLCFFSSCTSHAPGCHSLSDKDLVTLFLYVCICFLCI